MTIPIRIRLALLFGLGTAIIIAVGGFVFVNELSDGLRNSVAASLESRAAFTLATDPSVNQLSTVFGETDAPVASGDFAQLLDPRGRLLDRAGPDSIVRLLSSADVAAARSRSRLFVRTPPGSRHEFLLFAELVPRGSNVLVVGSSLATVDQAIDGIVRSLLIGGPIAVVLAAAASALIAGAALRPVERMRRQASSISAHDSEATLDVPKTHDEIAALAHTLNELLARLHGAIGRQQGFVSAASHELRTPLTNLTMELDLASRPNRSAQELHDAVIAAREEVERLARISESLLILARSDEHAPLVLPAPHEIASILDTTVSNFLTAARLRGVSIRCEVESGRVIDVDELALRSALSNLIDNAMRFAPPGSTVRVVGRDAVTGDGVTGDGVPDQYVIEVLDDGPGIDEAFLPTAFERFSRPDASRNRSHGGAGLGLAIVKALIESHGGTVGIENRQKGALARITLPVARETAEVTRSEGTNSS